MALVGVAGAALLQLPWQPHELQLELVLGVPVRTGGTWWGGWAVPAGGPPGGAAGGVGGLTRWRPGVLEGEL